jgi:hypothetical protein
MIFRRLLPLLAVPMISLGCSSGSHACPAVFIPAIAVTVTDASGAPICDAQVTIAKGSKDESTPPVFITKDDAGAPLACSYTGGWEVGTFTVTVARDGYVSQTLSANSGPADDCGVTRSAPVSVVLTKS